MIGTILGILLGVVVVLAITAATGYFVAQEFGYMAVDRARLRARAADGDAAAVRALAITRRTSFMLSGAQLGITVTGLLVGYVAEPVIGDGIGTLLGGAGIPTAVGVAVGTVFALLLSTVVQMVFGELFPKNLAIARPEPVARHLAGSTRVYLALFGWLIRVFDAASNALLGLLRIEPVHDVEHSASPRDLAAIIDDSRESGDLRPDLARLLDRAVDFDERTARAAMVPRPRVAWVAAEASVASLVTRMAAAHSRYPVLARPATGDGDRELVGVVGLRDVLAASDQARDLDRLTVAELARDAVVVPTTLPLPAVLARLRDAGEELACVLDEYGGLAGVVTGEDLAEELVGEITDEHDRAGTDDVRADPGTGWLVPADHHVDEVGRLLAVELPAGDYETIGGLVTARLRRLPAVGDSVAVPIEAADPDEAPRELAITVRETDRRVPSTVHVTWVGGGAVMTVVEIVVSVALIALSAFFVAVEFALVAARTHRLEESARTSASARAALRSAKDLSLLLAGSQLGITLCVLGLGAVTKPAVDDALGPLLEGWGVPTAVADVAAFVLSLVVVTFLHLVVGEMAPKSWAIAHPERSAVLLALPMRAFMTVTRPLLVLLNGAANRCLRLLGVEPVDEMAGGRTPDDLRELVDHSASVGALDGPRRDRLVAVLELDATPVGELVRDPVGVDADDDAEAVRAVSRASGHLRLVVHDDGPVGYVHVRDTLTRHPDTTARTVMRPLLRLDAAATLHAAATRMREERTHLAVVESGGEVLGVVTLADVVGRLLPA